MEGWYYRLTTPEGSFALIVSIEDAGNRRSDLNLACIQIVGPADSYLVQADTDDTKFWAWKHQQGLGCRFASRSKAPSLPASATALDADDWKDQVGSGFQILPNHFLGKIDGHDGSLGGVLPSQGIPGKCNFDFTVAPRCGWGDADQPRQKSTGGWLSFFAIFEPHWQVTLADGCATGSIEWQNRTIHFTDAPFYAEKNWGAALPSKWYWTQCNSFPGYNQLSVTAGGGIRRLPLGGKEALGMVCVHFNDKFYQAVPWTGTMTWKVETWGYWEMYGRSEGDRPFEVEIILTADPVTTPGLVFRAPTPDEGMVYFCRDTFEAQTTLSLWELVWDSRSKSHVRKPGPPLIDRATSGEGGAEVGGGPWWDTWTANSQSQVSKPVMFLLRLPLRAQRLRDSLLRKQQPS
jgi:tocopherol cyclase